MPAGLLETLHPAESLHRLQAVHDLTESAHKVSNPEVHRHLLAHAGRLRDSMSQEDFTSEQGKLRHLRDTAPNVDIQGAAFDSLRELEDKHPQAPGVGEAIMRWSKEHPEDMPVAKSAAVSEAVERELARATARFYKELDSIRAEIEQFKRERGI
jgi:hypothetical protein